MEMLHVISYVAATEQQLKSVQNNLFKQSSAVVVNKVTLRQTISLDSPG